MSAALELIDEPAQSLGPTDPISLSTQQPGLERFRAEGGGYVAYTEQRGVRLTLGAPICPDNEVPWLANAFVERYPDAAFFYVTPEQLGRMQLGGARTVWAAGADQVVSLPCAEWPKEVASARRKALKAGLVLREVTGAELAAAAPAMREAQAAYLERQEVKAEMTFLTRPCLFERERDGRTFLIHVKGELLGFVVIDPYVTREGRAGWLLNLFRIHPTKLWGVYAAIVALLAEQLASEGAQELSLGFVPAAPAEYPMPWWLRAQVAVLRWFASRSKYLQSLARMKAQFPVQSVPRLCVSPRRLIVADLLALLRAQGIVLPGEGAAP